MRIARVAPSSPRPDNLTTPVHSLSHRRALLLAIVALMGLALLAAGPAAASPCGDRVIDDWYDGRIDGTYPLPCYDDAIEQLPRDLRDYSSAPDDIKRALQAAMRGEKAPPNRDAPTEERPDDDPVPETPPTGPGGDPGGDPRSDPGPTDTVASPGDTDSSASSIPIPLLVLAGLALLLIAGGSAGYIVRRIQARRVPPPPAV